MARPASLPSGRSSTDPGVWRQSGVGQPGADETLGGCCSLLLPFIRTQTASGCCCYTSAGCTIAAMASHWPISSRGDAALGQQIAGQKNSGRCLLLQPGWRRPSRPDVRQSVYQANQQAKAFGDDEHFNNLLYQLTFANHLPALLKYEDRNSMAFSVEEHVCPFWIIGWSNSPSPCRPQ